MLIRSHTTTLPQIFGELLLHSQVIFKNMRVPDDTFWWNWKCEWVKCTHSLIKGMVFAKYLKTNMCTPTITATLLQIYFKIYL